MIETQRSRYPVYEESIDNIIGLVLAKDLVPVLREPPAALHHATIMRPVHVVPGSREVEEVLADFKRLKEHMAVVLDEYGGTAGHRDDGGPARGDRRRDPRRVRRAGAARRRRSRTRTSLIPGATNIGELNERFGLDVPDDEYTTIGGYIFGALGRLPVAGDRVTAVHAVFTVRDDGRAAHRDAGGGPALGGRPAREARRRVAAPGEP